MMSPKRCLMCWEWARPGSSRCSRHAGPSGWAQRPSVGARKDLYGWAWQQLRKQVLTEADHVCACRDLRCDHAGPCPRHGGTLDHVKPLAQGGAVYDRANLQVLCWRCHAKKTAREGGKKPRRRNP